MENTIEYTVQLDSAIAGSTIAFLIAGSVFLILGLLYASHEFREGAMLSGLATVFFGALAFLSSPGEPRISSFVDALVAENSDLVQYDNDLYRSEGDTLCLQDDSYMSPDFVRDGNAFEATHTANLLTEVCFDKDDLQFIASLNG